VPEIVTLLCDKPKCGNEGIRVGIDIRGRNRVVILCDTHRKPVEDLYQLGAVAPAARPRVERGTGRSRLKDLIVDE
jgi:hypothetical protein